MATTPPGSPDPVDMSWEATGPAINITPSQPLPPPLPPVYHDPNFIVIHVDPPEPERLPRTFRHWSGGRPLVGPLCRSVLQPQSALSGNAVIRETPAIPQTSALLENTNYRFSERRQTFRRPKRRLYNAAIAEAESNKRRQLSPPHEEEPATPPQAAPSRRRTSPNNLRASPIFHQDLTHAPGHRPTTPIRPKRSPKYGKSGQIMPGTWPASPATPLHLNGPIMSTTPLQLNGSIMMATPPPSPDLSAMPGAWPASPEPLPQVILGAATITPPESPLQTHSDSAMGESLHSIPSSSLIAELNPPELTAPEENTRPYSWPEGPALFRRWNRPIDRWAREEILTIEGSQPPSHALRRRPEVRHARFEENPVTRVQRYTIGERISFPSPVSSVASHEDASLLGYRPLGSIEIVRTEHSTPVSSISAYEERSRQTMNPSTPTTSINNERSHSQSSVGPSEGALPYMTSSNSIDDNEIEHDSSVSSINLDEESSLLRIGSSSPLHMNTSTLTNDNVVEDNRMTASIHSNEETTLLSIGHSSPLNMGSSTPTNGTQVGHDFMTSSILSDEQSSLLSIGPGSKQNNNSSAPMDTDEVDHDVVTSSIYTDEELSLFRIRSSSPPNINSLTLTNSERIERDSSVSSINSDKETSLLSVEPSTPVKGVDRESIDPAAAQLSREFEDFLISSDRHRAHRSAVQQEADRIRKEEAAEQARQLEAEEARKKAEEEAIKKAEEDEECRASGRRRLPVESVLQPLTTEWETRLRDVLGKRPNEVVARTCAGNDIDRRDIGKVLPQPGSTDDPSGWLNDNAINAYLDTVVDHGLRARGHRRGETPKLHAFNSAFYNNISEKGAESVKRWSRRPKIAGRDLLKVEHVFIPVNVGGAHWTLLVISPAWKRIEYFDSLHGSAATPIRNAKAWINMELGGAWKEEEWTVVEDPSFAGRGKGPRQTNGSDCGVFTVTSAKMISLGVDPMAITAADMPLQRRRVVAELVNGGFYGDFEPHVVF